jgi:Icc-related predicted phosphoesterase
MNGFFIIISTQHDKERNVKKSIGVVMFVSALMVAGDVAAQGMLLDFAADKVIQKFQKSTCAELRADKKQPPTEKEKLAVEFLRNDKQARVAFIDKIAAPVLNKMFECGMIP